MAELDRTGAFAWDDPADIRVISAAAYERERRGTKTVDWLSSLVEDVDELSKRAKRLDARAP